MGDTFTNLHEAIQYFSDPDRCLEFIAALRWPNGPVCPRCDCNENIAFINTRKLWRCRACQKQFSVKVGTIFEESPIALDKWCVAAWLIGNCKNGVSSCEVARDLGVTQKTAWFMLHRIRRAMRTGSFAKLSGEVEADESFIGGKARNMHKSKREEKITGTGGKDKTIVMGMVERGGEVRAFVVDNRRKKQLQKDIREHIEAGSAIFSDELKSYEGLEVEYQHSVINHAVEYANGNVHTNTMENFWSLLKRGLHGTYISVEPFHLGKYIDEQAFRYNTRNEMTDAERFQGVLSRIAGKRLTYKELTGKMDDGPTPA
jgi:transposase-like protein